MKELKEMKKVSGTLHDLEVFYKIAEDLEAEVQEQDPTEPCPELLVTHARTLEMLRRLTQRLAKQLHAYDDIVCGRLTHDARVLLEEIEKHDLRMKDNTPNE